MPSSGKTAYRYCREAPRSRVVQFSVISRFVRGLRAVRVANREFTGRVQKSDRFTGAKPGDLLGREYPRTAGGALGRMSRTAPVPGTVIAMFRPGVVE